MALHGYGKKLTWRDFKVIGKSPDGEFDASTAVRLASRWWGKRNPDGTFAVSKASVTIAFDHLHSWVVKGKQNDALLTHEQAHYEIAAIAGRTMEQQLLALTAASADDLKAAADRIMEEIAGAPAQMVG